MGFPWLPGRAHQAHPRQHQRQRPCRPRAGHCERPGRAWRGGVMTPGPHDGSSKPVPDDAGRVQQAVRAGAFPRRATTTTPRGDTNWEATQHLTSPGPHHCMACAWAVIARCGPGPTTPGRAVPAGPSRGLAAGTTGPPGVRAGAWRPAGPRGPGTGQSCRQPSFHRHQARGRLSQGPCGRSPAPGSAVLACPPGPGWRQAHAEGPPRPCLPPAPTSPRHDHDQEA